MTYKCDFCGKIHTDPTKYTECVQKCSETMSEKAKKIAELEKQIKYHHDQSCFHQDECRRLSGELYELDPTAYNKGSVVHVCWPNLEEFFKGFGF